MDNSVRKGMDSLCMDCAEPEGSEKDLPVIHIFSHKINTLYPFYVDKQVRNVDEAFSAVSAVYCAWIQKSPLPVRSVRSRA